MKKSELTKSELKKQYFAKKSIENILRKDNALAVQYVDLFMLEYNSNDSREVKHYDNIIDYIVAESIHEKYTVSIIKSIASSPSHFCNKSCLDIVNSGYTQHILDDIKQEVFLTLFNLIENNHCTYIETSEENKIEFDTYINSNDKETSYFMHLFKTVEKFFYSEKKQNESRYTKIKYDEKKHGSKAFVDSDGNLCDRFGNAYLKGCRMEYLDSYNDDATSVNSSNYREYLHSIQQENSLENIVERDDIRTFFKLVKKHYPKYYSDFCGIFEGLHNGYSYEEISKVLDIKITRIWYLIPLLRQKYQEFREYSKIELEKTWNVSLYSDTTRNKGCTYYINRENKKDMIIPKITKTYKEEKRIVSTPNYDYSMPEHTLAIWRQEKEDEKNAIIERTTKLLHVVDIKKGLLVTINNSGDIIRTYNILGRIINEEDATKEVTYCKQDNVKKLKAFAKRHGLDIL